MANSTVCQSKWTPILNLGGPSGTNLQWALCGQRRLRSACSVWSDSALIVCALHSLQAIQRGINENPCHTRGMYRLIWVYAGHRSCRFSHTLAHIGPPNGCIVDRSVVMLLVQFLFFWTFPFYLSHRKEKLTIRSVWLAKTQMILEAVKSTYDQRRLWPDCANAKANLRLHWSHKSYWMFFVRWLVCLCCFLYLTFIRCFERDVKTQNVTTTQTIITIFILRWFWLQSQRKI